MPCAAVVGDVDVGTCVVVIAYAVVVVDGVVPACGVPAHGTVEVVECAEQVVLPVEEYAAEVDVAVLPVGACDVGGAVEAHEVVEVDLVGAVVLLGGEVELVGHFVGDEPCLLARVVVADGACCECHDGYDEGE